LGTSHPGYGDDHGFTVHFVPTPPLTGNWGVAVYGLNVDAGADTSVGGVISS
jgi:hypothetical protein